MSPLNSKLNGWVHLHSLLASELGNDAARELLHRAWAMTRLRPCDPTPETLDSLLLALEIVGQERVTQTLSEFRRQHAPGPA